MCGGCPLFNIGDKRRSTGSDDGSHHFNIRQRRRRSSERSNIDFVNAVNNIDTVLDDEEVDAVLDARLDVKFNDEVLSEENYLTSGDEFTVDYVLSIKDYEVNGVAGLFNYDKTLFELVSIEINNEWVGNNKDGKFVYLGEESLIGPELDETLPEEDVTPQNDDSNTEPVEPIKYVILTATFKTLAATTEESDNVISLEEIELTKLKQFSPVITEDFYNAISLNTCVNERNVYGGPSEKAIEKAIKHFEGEHDFKGFKASGTSSKSSIRTIYSAKVIEDGDRINIELQGKGNIVGGTYEKQNN